MSKAIIVTHSGVEFDILNPTSDMIRLDDVAYALSNLCRYTGHPSSFYSVAEHCVHCSNVPGPIEVRKAYLLHDLAEAYMNDLSSPLKGVLPEYRKIEENIICVAFSKFGLNDIAPWDERIKTVDKQLLRSEIYQLMPQESPAFDGVFMEGSKWEEVVPVYCWSPEQAWEEFLNRAKELGLGGNDE